ncbi:MAG: hypothetical protein ACKOTZ_02290 [Chloroflexota bacterium]
MPDPATIVWIDSREAIVARLDGDAPAVVRMESAIPAHRTSTGHVAHTPTLRHGGGGSPQDAGELHRQEHIERFLATVTAALPDGERLLILGPGTIRERLEARVRADDRRRRRTRAVTSEAASRTTERRIVERLRAENGALPPRREATVRG